MTPLAFVYDDGGRGDAGYRGSAGDCAVRAVAIATGVPYREVYDALFEIARDKALRARRKRHGSPRDGVHREVVAEFLRDRCVGWSWVPTMRIGSGCMLHLDDELLGHAWPNEERLVVSLSRHYAAVVGGVIRDTHDPSRDGTRCVYGYWQETS